MNDDYKKQMIQQFRKESDEEKLKSEKEEILSEYKDVKSDTCPPRKKSSKKSSMDNKFSKQNKFNIRNQNSKIMNRQVIRRGNTRGM